MLAADLDFSNHIAELVPDFDNRAFRDVALSKIGSHQTSESDGIFRSFKVAVDGERGHIDLTFAAIGSANKHRKSDCLQNCLRIAYKP